MRDSKRLSPPRERVAFFFMEDSNTSGMCAWVGRGSAAALAGRAGSRRSATILDRRSDKLGREWMDYRSLAGLLHLSISFEVMGWDGLSLDGFCRIDGKEERKD